jgi:hypothetical protein
LQYAGAWNWAAVTVGGLADAELYSNDYETDQIRRNCLEMLLEGGGEAEARLLLAMAAQVTGKQLIPYIRVLAKFVTPEKKDDLIDPLRQRLMVWEERPANAEPISDETQQAIVKFICAKADANGEVEVCQAAIWEMKRWRCAGTRSALRDLVAQHPSRSIAEATAQVLKAWDEDATVPAKLGPVRYRILINGKPYANREITVLVCESDKSYHQSNEQTDADGEVQVSRDYFLNRKMPLFGVVFKAKGEGSIGIDVAFAVQAPPMRGNGNEVVPVDVLTKPLELSLDLPRELKAYAERRMNVRANGPDMGTPRRDELQAWRWFSTDIAKQVATPELMAGKYHVTIRLPGAKFWYGEVDVSKNTMLKIDFKKGTDVTYKVKTPPGNPWFFPWPDLFKGGIKIENPDYDANARTYCGLSPGKYVMRFPSSEEWAKTGRIGKMTWPAKVVAFEIPEDLPMEMDLGEIDLDMK